MSQAMGRERQLLSIGAAPPAEAVRGAPHLRLAHDPGVSYPRLTFSDEPRWRCGLPRRGAVLLNAHWHEPRGGARTRCCPLCDADVAADDHAVHYGGELYHADCALYPREQP